MHASGTAEGHEREAARVETALDADHAQRAHHLRLRDRGHADGRPRGVSPMAADGRKRRRPAPVATRSRRRAVSLGSGSPGRGRHRSPWRRCRRGRTRGARRARECRLTRRRRWIRSTRIEPPPALTVCTSTTASNRMPAMIELVVVCASPSTSATSVLVPPMSNEQVHEAVAAAGVCRADNPAAGPERTQADARASLCSRSRTPPDDCITSGGGSPAARSRAANRSR